MVPKVILGQRNMISIFYIDKYSSSINHTTMACCHFGAKQDWKNLKNDIQGKFWSENSNILFTFNIDKSFINYPCNDDMFSKMVKNSTKGNIIFGVKIHYFTQCHRYAGLSLM